MKILIPFLMLLFSGSIIAQSDSLFTETLSELMDANNLEEVIKLTDEKDSLTARHQYIRGIALYYMEKDSEALKVFDEIIAEDSASRGSRFYKSMIHYSRSELEVALSTINDAINVDEDPDFYLLKGEILFAKEEQSTAIESVRHALTLENCSERAYSVLAEMYYYQSDLENALAIYLEGTQKVQSNSPFYEDLYFNGGLIAYLAKNYKQANHLYAKLYETHPTPNIAAKLIQSYYAIGEYQKGNALKPSIYKAWEANEVEEVMKTEFCFDQFEWEDKTIMAFEQFEEPEGRLYYKHIFYVVDKEGKISETVQTEWSFAIEMNDSGMKYVLGRDLYPPDGGDRIAHYSYFQYLFKEDFEYANLKEAVLAVLNKEASASSSSSYGTESSENEKGKKKKRKKKKKKSKRT